MEYEQITYELDDHVAVLTYDRPEQRNAVSRRMNEELHHAWRRFRDDDDAFVLVITGRGEAFCAGWDLQDAAAWPRPEWDEFRTHVYDSAGDCGYSTRVDVFKPVIAAVNGWAVAAGLENALLADIRIVARNAVFGALERRWNIVAGDGMTVRLPLVVGYAKAMELIITGRPVDAEEALRSGSRTRSSTRGRRYRGRWSWPVRSQHCPRARSAPTRRRWRATSGRTYEERLRNEVEAALSMFWRRDSHAIGASAFKRGETPEWPNHGL